MKIDKLGFLVGFAVYKQVNKIMVPAKPVKTIFHCSSTTKKFFHCIIKMSSVHLPGRNGNFFTALNFLKKMDL